MEGDVEEIVKRTYYDKFPNLTPQQVRDLVVNYHLNSGYDEERQDAIDNLPPPTDDEFSRIAKLCIEFYDFDMKHRREMRDKLFELTKADHPSITKGVCCKKLQNLYDDRDNLMREITTKTRDIELEDTDIKQIVRACMQSGEIDVEDLKSRVFENLWFDYGEGYRMGELQNMIQDFFIRHPNLIRDDYEGSSDDYDESSDGSDRSSDGSDRSSNDSDVIYVSG